MGSLRHSSPDIEFLENRGIIINNLVAGEHVWHYIDGIRKEVVLKDLHYGDLCAYGKSWCSWLTRLASWGARWRKYWRALKHDLWSIISFVAAVLLLLLFKGLAAVYGVPVSFYITNMHGP